MQACGARRQMRQIIKFCKKIQMDQKEPFNSTVKDHHFNLVVSFNRRDDFVHLRKYLRTEDVERRVVKRDSPIFRRAPDEMYSSSLGCGVILICYCVVFLINGH